MAAVGFDLGSFLKTLQKKLTAGERMKATTRLAPALATATLLAAGAADAALLNGFTDASNNTSVFISVVERNATNQVLRNLVIDTGARTLATFAGTPWSTTAAQETQILNFLATAGATSIVRFNIGGALNDQSFSTDLQGFLTTGAAIGPGPTSFSQLGSSITNIDTFIQSTGAGTFNANGILAANSAINPGWHNNSWGNDVGGGIETNNEVLFGANSQLVGWKTDASFEIIRSLLGPVRSDRLTGDISFGAAVVPVPAAVWLMGSAIGLLGVIRRRSQTA
jgi:hypothetical protein